MPCVRSASERSHVQLPNMRRKAVCLVYLGYRLVSVRQGAAQRGRRPRTASLQPHDHISPRTAPRILHLHPQPTHRRRCVGGGC